MWLSAITSSVGAEDIDAIDDEEWIVKDNVRKFARVVVELLNNDKLRKKIGKTSSQFVSANFSWKIAKK